MPHAGAKECPAAEPHGLPRPVLGTNGEVTAVSTSREAIRNALAAFLLNCGWRQPNDRGPQGFPSGRA